MRYLLTTIILSLSAFSLNVNAAYPTPAPGQPEKKSGGFFKFNPPKKLSHVGKYRAFDFAEIQGSFDTIVSSVTTGELPSGVDRKYITGTTTIDSICMKDTTACGSTKITQITEPKKIGIGSGSPKFHYQITSSGASNLLKEGCDPRIMQDMLDGYVANRSIERLNRNNTAIYSLAYADNVKTVPNITAEGGNANQPLAWEDIGMVEQSGCLQNSIDSMINQMNSAIAQMNTIFGMISGDFSSILAQMGQDMMNEISNGICSSIGDYSGVMTTTISNAQNQVQNVTNNVGDTDTGNTNNNNTDNSSNR